jgi:two-component system, OmpR family, response regulator
MGTYNGGMKILVVEDEWRIAQAMKKGLEQERYVVDTAGTGTEGLDLAMTDDYDLILLDLMLPEMDGLQVCREIRAKANHTPILMLTAKDQIGDKVQGLNTGADDYLTKPFAFKELVARVRALARRPREAVAPVLTAQDLVLDPSRYRVERAGQSIQLSNKEFAILEFLMRRPNTIVSKQQILDNIWHLEDDVLPNIVEVYVGNLRNKIDRPFPTLPPLITTVRGFGYRLENKQPNR